MEEKFKKIGSKTIYKGKKVHLVLDKLQTPEGKETEWELIKHSGAAAVIPFDDDGNIIMVRQYRHAADDYTLEIPAGTLEPGEDPKECACRELEEETGFKSDSIEFLYKFYSCIGICDEVIHIYVARNLVPSQQNLDDDEFVTIEKYKLEELVEMIYTGELMDNKSISAVLALKNKLEN